MSRKVNEEISQSTFPAASGGPAVSLEVTTNAQSPSRTERTFVLVHGAWHGGWCYARVATILRANGHRVFTPTLSGLGENSHRFSGDINLSTHVDDIRNLILWEGLDDIILCGHSYGGMVVTGVLERLQERISTVVYLDAFVPSEGQSIADLNPRTLDGFKGPASPKQGLGVPPVPAVMFGVNAADRAWVDAQCTPQPIATLLQKNESSSALRKHGDRHYILATGYENGGIFTAFHDEAAKEGWATAKVASGHDVMLDAPEWLADYLLALRQE